MSQARRTLVRSLCTMVAAVVVALALLPVAALADSAPAGALKISKLKGTVTTYLQGKKGYSYVDVTCKKGKLTKVKSSNTKVVDVYPWGEDWKDANGFTIVGLKKGKATVTYTYKGKKYKVKVVVKKYSNPVKVLKVGKKNYARKLKKNCYIEVKKWSAWKGKKINVTPANGWKIKSIKYISVNSNYTKYSTKKVRNGGKLPKKSGVMEVIINLQNTKNGANQIVYAYFLQ